MAPARRYPTYPNSPTGSRMTVSDPPQTPDMTGVPGGRPHTRARLLGCLYAVAWMPPVRPPA